LFGIFGGVVPRGRARRPGVGDLRQAPHLQRADRVIRSSKNACAAAVDSPPFTLMRTIMLSVTVA